MPTAQRVSVRQTRPSGCSNPRHADRPARQVQANMHGHLGPADQKRLYAPYSCCRHLECDSLARAQHRLRTGSAWKQLVWTESAAAA
eukprot:scaffold531654_cov34-Prasinocladus_malaysianus.AAC.1